MKPRFLIAKYIPVLSRLEPRNIGVIVWLPGHLEMKFIDSAQAPFLKGVSEYRECADDWVAFGKRDQLQLGGRPPVTKDSAKYLDEFRRLEEPSFMLMDAGDVLDNVRPKELPDVTAFLFDQLVAPVSRHEKIEAARNSIRQECRELFEESGFGNLVKAHYEAPGTVYGVPKTMKFSYGVGTDDPQAVFQVVHVARDSSVNDAAVRLHSIEKIVEPDCRAAIIKSEDEEFPPTNLKIIEGCAGAVIDLSKRAKALDQIATILRRVNASRL